MVNLFSLAPGGGQKVSAQVGSVIEELDFGNIASERHATKREYSTLESLAVFAFARIDLVRYHLESIDFEVKQVFVVLNTFSSDVTLKMRKVLKLFDCSQPKFNLETNGLFVNREFQCLNPMIRALNILESHGSNFGFAGSFNVIAKKMLIDNISYTIISNDDTSFRPGSLRKIAKIFAAKPKLCLLLFSHFSSFGITQLALHKIGVMDENFWPAYSEDIDYYLRSILGNCQNFHASDRRDRFFVNHGENPDIQTESTTLKSGESYRRMIKNTEDKYYGRDAYLCRKWGGPCPRKRDFLNSNKAFKAIFRRNREEHEILSFQDQFTSLYENLFHHPYNDSSLQISWWNNTKTANSVASPRSVNKNYAPVELVWKLRDWSLLSSESILGGKNI
jgi:hypothetical protein